MDSLRISYEDIEILADPRRVDHPSEFGELVSFLPADRDTLRIIATYIIAADDQRGPASCAECGRMNNHWHGLVMQAPDGTYVSIGQCCAKQKHKIVFHNVLEEFSQRGLRAGYLNKFVVADTNLAGITAFLRTLPSLPQVERMRKTVEAIEQRLPKLYNGLKGAQSGRLTIVQRVKDMEAMGERRKDRDKKADAYIERMKRIRQQKDEPSAAEIEAHFHGDEDFSKVDLFKEVETKVEDCVGLFLLTGVPCLQKTIDSLVKRLEDSVRVLRSKETKDHTNASLATQTRVFTKAIEEGIALVDSLNEARDFFMPSNLAAIIRWANRDRRVAVGRSYEISQGAIACIYPTGEPLKVSLPEVMPIVPHGLLPEVFKALEPGSDEGTTVTTNAA